MWLFVFFKIALVFNKKKRLKLNKILTYWKKRNKKISLILEEYKINEEKNSNSFKLNFGSSTKHG